MNYAWVNNFGQGNKLNLSDTTFSAGLGFEFLGPSRQSFNIRTIKRLLFLKRTRMQNKSRQL